jgi:hypothetical protein
VLIPLRSPQQSQYKNINIKALLLFIKPEYPNISKNNIKVQGSPQGLQGLLG